MEIDCLAVGPTPHNCRILEKLAAMETPMASRRDAKGIGLEFCNGTGNHVQLRIGSIICTGRCVRKVSFDRSRSERTQRGCPSNSTMTQKFVLFSPAPICAKNSGRAGPRIRQSPDSQ